jgi:hypothetical protein
MVSCKTYLGSKLPHCSQNSQVIYPHWTLKLSSDLEEGVNFVLS